MCTDSNGYELGMPCPYCSGNIIRQIEYHNVPIDLQAPDGSWDTYYRTELSWDCVLCGNSWNEFTELPETFVIPED